MERKYFLKVVVLSAVIFILFVNTSHGRHIKRSPRTRKGVHHAAHHNGFSDRKKRGEVPADLEVDGTKFHSIGCFRDAWNRVLPALEGEHQLLMEPNYKARKFALIKCARAAMDKRLKIFGIENGGQCFGADEEKSLDKYGAAVECRRDGKGGPWSLQAYKFTVLPTNGAFSPWSRWTTCSKTCDHGVRRRMRTCSSPPPSDGGKDCSGLGPSVEGEICKDKECPAVLIGEPETANAIHPTIPSTPPSHTTAIHAITSPSTTASMKNKETLKTNDQSNIQSQSQFPTKSIATDQSGKPNGYAKDASITTKTTNELNKKISTEAETSSPSLSLLKDGEEKKIPESSSKEVSQPSVSAKENDKKVSTKVESSSPTQSDQQKGTKTSSKTSDSKVTVKKPKMDSSVSPNGKEVASQGSTYQESGQTGYPVYQDPEETGSQEPNQPGSQATPGSEPYQFIDEPEDQRESNNNIYSMPSMHQSENLKAHEQTNLPGNSQDIDPSIVEDTYNGGPVVSSSAVQLNTPLGPVVMGEVNPINSNFNPVEVRNDQPINNDECFCPKKVCDAKADIVFLVDGSSDIPQIYFAHVLDFMKALTRGFVAKDTQVSLVAYGEDAASAFDFSPVSNLHEIDDSIDSVTYMGGEPRTGNALVKVKNGIFGMNSRKDSSHALVLLTSGSSSDDSIQAANELKDAGIKLTTIGLGKLANVKELIDISSEPKSSHVFTAFLDTLPDIMNDIVKGVCSDIKGKLHDRTEACVCENNKEKDSKQTSPVSLSEPNRAKTPQKEASLTSDKAPEADRKNQSKLNSNEIKGSKLSPEKTNSDKIRNVSSSNQTSTSTDSHEQSLKSDSKNTETDKETTTGSVDSISKLPSEEKPSQPVEIPQSQKNHSQEEPPSSHEKQPQNTPIKEVKTDLKVQAPVPQFDKDEKAIPKKDENQDKEPKNGSPTNVRVESPPNGGTTVIKLTPSNEDLKGSSDIVNNVQKPSDSGKQSTSASDNKSDTLQETSQFGLFPLTPKEPSTDAPQKEVDRDNNSQEQQNEVPTAAEETSTGTPAVPTEPPSLKKQQEAIATPSKETNAESNASKTAENPKSQENGQSKPNPAEKVLEATESSFPPRKNPPPKEQPKPSKDQQSKENETADNSKSSDVKSDKTLAQQVEVPNPTSKEPKEPPSSEPVNKTTSDEKKEESSAQAPPQELSRPSSYPAQEQVSSPSPGTSLVGIPLPQEGGSSEQSSLKGEDNNHQPTISSVSKLPSFLQQNENTENGNHSSIIEKTGDALLKECSINLGVVLDSKTTAYGDDDNAKKLLQFSKKVTHMFPVSPEGNRVGMMVYSGSPKLKVVHFDHFLDADTMDKAIDSASYLNMEIKTGRVLNFAQEHLFSRLPSGKQNVLLLITDGVSYDDVTSPSLELKRRGVEIFAIGVGENVVRKELESIASDPAEDHVVMTSYDVSDGLLDDIKKKICSSAERKGQEAHMPRRRGNLYRVLTEIDRRRKRNQ